MQSHLTEMRSGLAALQADLEAKTSDAQAAWEAFESARSAAVHGNLPAGDAERLHTEYAAKTAEVAELRSARDAILGALSGPGVKGGNAHMLTAGEKAIASPGYKELVRSGALRSDSQRFEAKLADMSVAEFKAVISSGTQGTFVGADHQGVVAQPQRPLRLLDLCNVGQTASDTIEFARQTSTTNYATEVAEATTTDTGTKPEATIPFEKVTVNVQTIAHWVPATRRSLADGGQLQQIINAQLIAGLLDRLEDQLISGNGTSPNLRGILNTSGILSQAKSTDSIPDAIHKGITQLRLANVEPTGVLLHPTDYEALRLTRDNGGYTAGTGAYLFGPPALAGQPSVWGVPAVVSACVPDDTVIVGDFQQLAVWIREAPFTLVSDSHDDFFVRNLCAILSECRVGAALLQPNAFVKVTSVD